jgi:hypothetical protein
MNLNFLSLFMHISCPSMDINGIHLYTSDILFCSSAWRPGAYRCLVHGTPWTLSSAVGFSFGESSFLESVVGKERESTSETGDTWQALYSSSPCTCWVGKYWRERKEMALLSDHK